MDVHILSKHKDIITSEYYILWNESITYSHVKLTRFFDHFTFYTFYNHRK